MLRPSDSSYADKVSVTSVLQLNERTFPTAKSFSTLPRSTVLSISHNTQFSSHCLRNSETTAASDVGLCRTSC